MPINIKGTRLSVLSHGKTFEDLEGWYIYDYNDILDGDDMTEPGFYLLAGSKNRNYGITLSQSAILQMASIIREYRPATNSKTMAYGQVEKCCGGSCDCGTNVE